MNLCAYNVSFYSKEGKFALPCPSDLVPFEPPDNPAKAGIGPDHKTLRRFPEWIPTFSGMISQMTRKPRSPSLHLLERNVLSKSKLGEDKEAAMNLGLLWAIAAFPAARDRVFDVSRAAFLLQTARTEAGHLP